MPVYRGILCLIVFVVLLSSAAGQCGNGVINSPEQCDDGDTTSGDGCANNCVREVGWNCTGQPSICKPICGDGRVVGAAKNESCDDQNRISGDGCSANCSIEVGFNCTGNINTASICKPICGDGLKIGNERCDDGNKMNNDGCHSNCTIEIGYICTEQNNGTSLCSPICGDGRVVKGKEICDDGNLISSDGCTSNCTVEMGYNCTGGNITVRSFCFGVCGDSYLLGPSKNESCDDGNVLSDDGCSSICTVENGYDCIGNISHVSSCYVLCGDGMMIKNESCDDGNSISGDGCSDTCSVESGWICTNATETASVCERIPTSDDEVTSSSFSSSSSEDEDSWDFLGNNGRWILIGCAGGVILVGIVALVVFLKKKKPKIIHHSLQRLSRLGRKHGELNYQEEESGSIELVNNNGNKETPQNTIDDYSANNNNGGGGNGSIRIPANQRNGSVTPTAPSTMRSPSTYSTRMSPQTRSTLRVNDDLYKSSPNKYPEYADYSTSSSVGTYLFGSPIELVPKDGYVPAVIERTIQHLEKYALDEEGILRLAGSATEMRALKQAFDEGSEVDFKNVHDVQSVAGILKLYLRELPKPLLLMTRGLKEVADSSDPDFRVSQFREELQHIPEVNYFTLQRLFRFLRNVTEHSSKNKMSSANLAIVFHPTLQLKMELIQLMIASYYEIFE